MSTRRSPSEVVDLLEHMDRLASLPRTGWLLRGVTDPESIAEHCFGAALVAAMLVDDLRAEGVTVDGERVLRMTLLHDAAETFTGDIPMPAKTEGLRRALGEAEQSLVAQKLGGADLALWKEAEEGTTLEARVVKAADKIQMLTKALVYEKQRRGRLDEFWQNVKNRTHGELAFAKALFEELDRRAKAER